MDNLKTLTFPRWLEQLQGGDKVTGSTTAYQRVPLIFRAVNIRCNSLTAVPLKLYKGRRELEWDDVFTTPLRELVWLTEAALLFEGHALWEKLDAQNRRYGARWLNPLSMTVQAQNVKDDDGKTRIVRTFKQYINGALYADFTADEVVYFRDFNLADDVGAGVSSVAVALGDAGLLHYMTRMASYFFEGGAMPVTILGVPQAISESERERTESWFKRAAAGVSKFMNVLAVRGGQNGLQATILTPPMKDLAIPDLKASAVQNIAWAFGIPETMLTDAANYATAVEHKQGFYTETIIPRADLLCETITAQFLADLGMRLEADPESMDIFQKDEAERAASLSSFMDALEKFPTAEIALATLTMFGYELPADYEVILQAYYAEKEKMREQVQAQTQQTPGAPAEDDDDQVREEVRRWRTKALKRGAGVEFVTDIIPVDTQSEIRARLAGATTPDEIKAAFEVNTPRRVDDPLVAELKRANDLLERENATKAGDSITLTIPAINITAQMPAQEPPTVNVSAAPVTVNVPEQAAPTVNVAAPNVTVEAPNVQIDNTVMIPEREPREIMMTRKPDGTLIAKEK